MAKKWVRAVDKIKNRQIIKRLNEVRLQKQKTERPVRVWMCLDLMPRIKVTKKCEVMIERWVAKEDWLTASNLVMLHDQGHELTPEQISLYDAWKYGSRNAHAYIKKTMPYERLEARNVDFIANVDCLTDCICCGHEFARTRLRANKREEMCMFCKPVCCQSEECKIIGFYEIPEHRIDPFPEVEFQEIDTVFQFPENNHLQYTYDRPRLFSHNKEDRQ